MRELTTIGSLSMRAVERQRRMRPLLGMGYVGQTNASFAGPSLNAVDADPPGSALSAANVAMLNHFQADGVPSEHTSDPYVLAFQQAYNKDPAPWAALTMKLGEDGGYGDNTHDASAALVDYTGGGTPPPVNSGAAPVVAPPATPTAPAKPSAIVPAASGGSHAALWLLAIVAAIGAAYAAHRMMKKKRARRRAAALPSRAIVLT